MRIVAPQAPLEIFKDDRIAVRIREACRITGIGRSKLYELIASGDIPTIKIGAITLVPVEGIRAFIDGQRQAADKSSLLRSQSRHGEDSGAR